MCTKENYLGIIYIQMSTILLTDLQFAVWKYKDPLLSYIFIILNILTFT